MSTREKFNKYGSGPGSNSSNWDILFTELDTMKQQSAKVVVELESLKQQISNIDKKLDTSISRVEENLNTLKDYVEDRLNTNSRKIQKNVETMFEMNTALEKNSWNMKKNVKDKSFYLICTVNDKTL